MKSKICIIPVLIIILFQSIPCVLSEESINAESKIITKNDLKIWLLGSFLYRTHKDSFGIKFYNSADNNLLVSMNLSMFIQKTGMGCSVGKFTMEIPVGFYTIPGFSFGTGDDHLMISPINVTIEINGIGDNIGLHKEKTVSGFMICNDNFTFFYFFNH